ncbi:ovarian cancer G-protein coupled receptor 1-like isoform X1 [Tachysurus vachellii]|uniref:ovarian cancer G-protein coupled receptor 1-like isoform X1 n=1 Tax=Tachysurus vachellii TaxID=175792 RepID=UPI00296B27BE|nr:ovarian cancer G-protein coupled receptor 1-like isoform X1 [Tachysurus vachellii]
MDENESISKNYSCTYSDTVAVSMYPAVYSTFFIIGLPGNCLSLYVAWVQMQKGNSLGVYLVNLSISDLLYIITLPVWIMIAMDQPVNDTLCSLIAVIMYNSFYVGSGLLCCISMDRYLAVVFPLYFARVHTVQTAAFVSMFVWLIEISVHIGLLAYTYKLQEFSSSQLCKIMMSLKRSASTSTSERVKIRNLLCILLVVYMVSFTPYQVVMIVIRLLENKNNNCEFVQQQRNCYTVFVATTTINSVLDPIVYCLNTESAKAEILRVYTVCRHQLSRAVSVMALSSSNDC